MTTRPGQRAMETWAMIYVFMVKLMAFTGVATWMLVGLIAYSIWKSDRPQVTQRPVKGIGRSER